MSSPVYWIKYKKLKQIIDDCDPIYYYSENDLRPNKLLDERNKTNQYERVMPSDDTYHDYYYHYMMERYESNYHRSIASEFLDQAGHPIHNGVKYKSKPKNYYMEINTRSTVPKIDTPLQPKYSEELLNRLDDRQYLKIYAKNK